MLVAQGDRALIPEGACFGTYLEEKKMWPLSNKLALESRFLYLIVDFFCKNLIKNDWKINYEVFD